MPEDLGVWKATRECFTVSTESECVLHLLEHFLRASKSKIWYRSTPIYHQPVETAWRRSGNRKKNISEICHDPNLAFYIFSPTPIISHISKLYFLNFYSSKTGKIEDEKIPHCKYSIIPKLDSLSTFWNHFYPEKMYSSPTVSHSLVFFKAFHVQFLKNQLG